MFTLRGEFQREEIVQYFTLNEYETALHVARQWFSRGWFPVLVGYEPFRVYFHYQNVTVAKAA